MGTKCFGHLWIAGPQKVRRRFTLTPRPLSAQLLITPAQLTFFKYWYNNVLLGGTLRFSWVDPWSDTVLTNLITNGGFDTGTTGWSDNSYSTIASITPSTILVGKCIELTRITGPYQSFSQYSSLTAGHNYVFSGWIMSGTSGDELGDLVVVDNSDEGELGRTQITTTTSWQNVSVSFICLNTGLHVFWCEKCTASEGSMLFDEVDLYDITEGILEFRFVEPPSWDTQDGLNITLNMNLEILP